MLAYLIPIAVVLCGAASAARAACALQLDGDPEVVSPVREAVEAFRDDGATCVDVRALCSRDDAAIVVDLRDQLGRSVQRRFTTPEGAAAFLISWSRRPLPQSGTGLEPDGAPPGATPRAASRAAVPPVATSRGSAPPGATPPANAPPAAAPGPRIAIAAGIPGLTVGASLPAEETPESAAAAAKRDAGIHPEVRAAYLSAPFGMPTVDGIAAMVETTWLIRRDTLRGGLSLRGTAADVSQSHFLGDTSHLSWVGLDAELTVGTRWHFKRITLGSDLFAGFGGVKVLSPTDSSSVEARTHGLRGGGRVTAASRLFSDIWFESRLSWDGLRQLGETDRNDEVLRSDRYLGQVHLEIGLLWAP